MKKDTESKVAGIRFNLHYNEEFVKGMVMAATVAGNMVRRKGVSPVTSPMTMGAVVQAIILAGEGDHLEIGSRLGGSAVVSAWALGENKTQRKIICVDPMEDLIPQIKYPTKTEMGDEKIFWDNMRRFGVDGHVELYQEYSDTYFVGYGSKTYSTAFVDGDHRYNGVRADLDNLKDRVSQSIVMDDVDYSGVQTAMSEFLYFNPSWVLGAYVYPTTAVLVKTSADNEECLNQVGLFNAKRATMEGLDAEV